MTMPNGDDIERFKIHKIPTEVVRREQGRVALGVIGQTPPSEQISDARVVGGEAPAEPLGPAEKEALEERVIEALKTVHDPEIPLNIYDLGLIYGVAIDDEANVEIEMTLTAPGCPVAGMIVREVASVVGALDGVRESHVKLTWSPPWTKDRMSDEAMLELGLL